MRAHEEAPGERAGNGRGHAPRPARATARHDAEHAQAHPVASPAAGPLAGPSAVTALQRSVGNRAVARFLKEDQGPDQHVHGDGCGHGGVADTAPEAQSALVAAAINSSGRPLPHSVRSKAEPFYQTNLSAGRLHDDAVAQRAIAAMGAEAMTIGHHVFLPPGASEELIGHELDHLRNNLQGVPETGKDNGAGTPVTDPDQGSERQAGTNGAAYAAGARLAPSIVTQRSADTTAGLGDREDGREDEAHGVAGGVPGGPVQRFVIPDNENPGDPQTIYESLADLEKERSFRRLHRDHKARVAALLDDDSVIYRLSEAIEAVKNTVVAAVDGQGGLREAQFLADAHGQRGNLSAYSPDMNVGVITRMLGQFIPGSPVTLEQGSVTRFGHHVPHTELLVPHPGPWAMDRSENGLAHCIERVLGRSSAAYVVTDNETAGHSQSRAVRRTIEEINNRNRRTDGYRPLRVDVTTPDIRQGPSGGRTTDVGGVELQIAHQPPYQLITVRRA
ncbi:eCIS core domain-containing protein [Streptomyces aureocirculatus]|uniref:eCIS core domain-containing protein n=1 Tax=Streptomyces aureocirculatus TaxID=67275 RepID=UPI00068E26B5|nr:DUF4157 domain-containing protein [Streptomyces aureocirculatus]